MNTYCLTVSNDDNVSKVFFVDADSLYEAVEKHRAEYGHIWPHIIDFKEM